MIQRNLDGPIKRGQIINISTFGRKPSFSVSNPILREYFRKNWENGTRYTPLDSTHRKWSGYVNIIAKEIFILINDGILKGYYK
jgi:hypothetical protein